MLFDYLSFAGVAVFAVSGALVAGEKRLDWVGVLALATATAVGGGTIRDVLLKRDTVFWIDDPTHLWVILVSTCVTIVYVRFFRPPMNALRIADALGLALFTITGAQVAEAEHASTLIVVVIGVITGAAGGVIRDVLNNKVPLIFRSTEPIYTVAALGGVMVYVVLPRVGASTQAAALIGIAVVALLRISAIIWNIRLPPFHIREKK